MNEPNENILAKQASYYSTNKKKVHVETVTKRWYNGIIISFDKEHIILLDHVTKTDMIIFYGDIRILEPYVEGGKY